MHLGEHGLDYLDLRYLRDIVDESWDKHLSVGVTHMRGGIRPAHLLVAATLTDLALKK